MRRKLVHLAIALAFVLVAAGCLLGGLLFGALALYTWATHVLGPAGAAFAAALLLLSTSGVLLWLAKKLSK